MIRRSFADIAVALKLQANELSDRAKDCEIVAGRIGLTPAVAAHVISERRDQAELIGEAHRIIYALIGCEETIRSVMGETR